MTHFSPITGQPRIVDVSNKAVTERKAIAQAIVQLDDQVSKILSTASSSGSNHGTKKGSPFQVATVAGIMAAKRTSETIPLCHQIPLNNVTIDFNHIFHDERTNNSSTVIIECCVRATWKTGVEMEALYGVSVAALTLYDMLKSISKGIIIERIQLIEKQGGKSGDFYNSNKQQ
jgi:cyclic pyranopterin phosphate synthase